MKKIILLLSFITGLLPAQNITHQYSQEFKTIKHKPLGFYAFHANDYTQAYYKPGKKMSFLTFDPQLSKPNRLSEALFPRESKRYTYERFSFIHTQVYWFYSTYDKKTRTERLSALPFNKDSLTFGSNPVNLIETKRLMAGQKYTFNLSKDSSKLLVTYTLKPTERKERLRKNVVGFYVFDDHLNKLYGAEIKMPYSDYDMNDLGYEVDSRGNIYMLAEVRVNNETVHPFRETKETKNKYRYELIRVNKQTNALQAIKINLENKFTKSAYLSEDLNGNIVIAGYYSNQNNVPGSEGAYIIRLEYDEHHTVKQLRTTYCEFPADTVQTSPFDKRVRDAGNKNPELLNLALRHVVFYEDGSILMVGEEFYYTTYAYRIGNGTNTITTYFYNDILVMKTDKNGKTQWCRKIQKNQSGSTSSDLSFHLHQYKGESYFFYLDNTKNSLLTLAEKPTEYVSGRDGYLTMVKIDAEGTMTKASILNTEEAEGLDLRPANFESVNDHVIAFLIGAYQKESKILKLEIN